MDRPAGARYRLKCSPVLGALAKGWVLSGTPTFPGAGFNLNAPVPTFEEIRIVMYARWLRRVPSYAACLTDSVEERIRDLCPKAISAPESECKPIIAEPLSLLHEHVARARELASASFLRKDDAA